MISVQGYIERQVQDTVIGRKVFCPEEGLLPQFNRRREETEHGKEDRHLQQHGKTSAHGAHPCFLVQIHGGLLLLHGIFLPGKLLRNLVNHGFHYTHLGLGPVRQGEQGQLDDKRQDQDNDPIIDDEIIKQVKYRDDHKFAYPSDNVPSQEDYLLKFNIILLQDSEAVRAVIHLHPDTRAVRE